MHGELAGDISMAWLMSSTDLPLFDVVNDSDGDAGVEDDVLL